MCGKMRRCRAVRVPAETGNTMVGKGKSLALSVPTQAALAAKGKESSPADWTSSAVASWKPHFSASHLAIFQRLMNSILSALIYCTWGVYFDDVIINSLSCELHLKDLNEVLVRTKETGITVKCKKCQF